MRRRWIDITERSIYLRSIPVAAMLPPAVLHGIASCLEERTFAAGEVVSREGDAIGALHLLIEGRLSLARGGNRIGVLEPPQSFGFLGILAASESPYDAIAEVETRSLDLRTPVLLELIEEHFSLLHATLQYAADRLLYEMQELPEQALSLTPETIPLKIGERPLDLVEKVLFLRCLSVFRQTNLSALTLLAQLMPEVRVEPGQRMWSAGDLTKKSLFIVDGWVGCEAADGRRFRYGPGTVAGGIEGLAGKPRWYSLTAETPVVALEGQGDELVDLLEDDFAMAMDFVQMLSRGLLGLLARKAALGQQMLQVKRDVSRLGAVPVGA